MAEVTAERVATSSIELDRNARGEYAWKVKVYFDAEGLEEERTSMFDALSIISNIDSHLRATYLVRS